MKTTLKTLIIDDEIRSRSVLRTMIEKYCNSIAICGEASTIEEAHQLITHEQPDLVFLDIELGLGTGFDLLGQIPDIRFKTIFITAYDHFAIKAIKWSAQDYILKPVDPTELTTAVNRVLATWAINHRASKSQNDTHEFAGKRIGLPTMDGLTFVDITDIIHCEAKGAYTEFSFHNKKKIMVSKPLQVYEDMLSSQGFYRVHNSYLINMAHIKEYVKGRGGSVVMADGANITVATRKKDDFLKHLLH